MVKIFMVWQLTHVTRHPGLSPSGVDVIIHIIRHTVSFVAVIISLTGVCLVWLSFCFLRSGSGHHLCQSGRPRGVVVLCESALWTFRTASDRKPADASWLPNEQLLSDRTQPQRGQTASRSTSLKPRHGFEVHGFILSSSRPPPPNTSSRRHTQPAVVICHCPSTFSSSVAILWVIPAEATLGKSSVANASFFYQLKWQRGTAIGKNAPSSLSEESGELV